MTDNREMLERLRGRKFPCLDKGWVMLNDAMGSDRTVVDRARGTTGTGSKTPEEDETLLRHMMRHHHGSSFEFPEIDLEICTTFVVWRQMIRHRAGNIYDDMTPWDDPSVNELSGRYSVVPEMIQETHPQHWRRQSKSSRQGSGGCFPEPDGILLGGHERIATAAAERSYRALIAAGVAKEQARKVWPMGGYTIGSMKMDLRNWLHWLTLRLPPDAQEEIRVGYAEVILREVVEPLFPVTIRAFRDYVLDSVTLTALDVEAVRKLRTPSVSAFDHFANARERAECLEKLRTLDLFPGMVEVTPCS